MPIPVSTLVARAAQLFDTTERDILSPSRLPAHTRPRHAVVYAARIGGRSLGDISRRLNRKGHKSAVNSCERAQALMEREPDYRQRVETLAAMARDFTRQHRHDLVPQQWVAKLKMVANAEREAA